MWFPFIVNEYYCLYFDIIEHKNYFNNIKYRRPTYCLGELQKHKIYI